jgi:site-specific recombinase XerD
LGPCAAQRVLPPPTPIKQYADHLRNERGLTERSIEIYLPHVDAFLRSQESRVGSSRSRALDAQGVRDFLLERVHNRSTAYARLAAASLRSFLRFLFLRGETPVDLSSAVPTVRRWNRAPVHAFLAPEAIDRVLAVPDRTTPSGRRDYAILLLLARLGLRAGEVVSLELGDLHWRAAEIVVRGKGRSLDRLPLPSDVGEALSAYLQASRIPTNSRRVFLRKIAPRVGLTGPSAVGCVVRDALARAGVARPYRYAAHIFRHSLATRMIRQGASLSQISEILRHRCPATTEIYAKVDFETLRGVARAWPVANAGSDR